MADIVSVKIQGLDEIEKKLYDLPAKFARRAMREAIKPALEPWKDEIQAGAAKGEYATGFAASKVSTRVTTRSRDESGTGMVGFTKEQNPARQGHAPSAANEMFWKEMGTVHSPARPFIRPAFQAKASEVLNLFTNKLKQIFDEVFQ